MNKMKTAIREKDGKKLSNEIVVFKKLAATRGLNINRA